MTTQLKSIALVLTLAALLGASASGMADEISSSPLEPASCSLVFQSASEAAAHCEKGSYAIPVKDLWNNNVVGYSCYCPGHSVPPTPPPGY